MIAEIINLIYPNDGPSIKAWLTIKTGNNTTSQYYLGKAKPGISFSFPALSYSTAIFTVGIRMNTNEIEVIISKGTGRFHQFDKNVIWKDKQFVQEDNIPNIFHFNIDTNLVK